MLCNLCPRNCETDRNRNIGYCGMTNELKVARAALHMWEEPCISGENGSGTVFFSGCQLKCIYCQNHNIAIGKSGKAITIDRLADIFIELQEKGANNINLVTPTHYVPQIIKALDLSRKRGLNLPVVYNTSSYEHVETLKMLEGYVDVYLPDFKYKNKQIALQYSNAQDYFEVAAHAIEEMYRQVGRPVFNHYNNSIDNQSMNNQSMNNQKIINQSTYHQNIDGYEFMKNKDKIIYKNLEDGIMTKGLIVRHLILPGELQDSKDIIMYLYKTYGDNIMISLMNQYTPLKHVEKNHKLSRKITEEEYEELINFAIDLGVENGFVQEGETASESFIPDFDNQGV